MAKYFMSGTKYEPFERMMMDSRRRTPNYEPQKKKNYSARKGSREKQRSK